MALSPLLLIASETFYYPQVCRSVIQPLGFAQRLSWSMHSVEAWWSWVQAPRQRVWVEPRVAHCAREPGCYSS